MKAQCACRKNSPKAAYSNACASETGPGSLSETDKVLGWKPNGAGPASWPKLPHGAVRMKRRGAEKFSGVQEGEVVADPTPEALFGA
jgi:hypothetical protein